MMPKRHLLGLDIGRSAIKVVQLASTRQGLVLRYAGLTERIPDEPAGEPGGGAGVDHGVTLALYDALKEPRIKRQKIAMNLWGSNPVVRYLMLPKMPIDELGDVIRWEAKKIISSPIEEMVLDYLVVGETHERNLERTEVLLVAAERTAILKQLEMIKQLNLPVSAMDVNPLALFNVLKLNYQSDLEQNLVFVDIGASKMDINISKRGILRFTRNVQLGGEDTTQAIMRGLQVERDEAEKLKREKGFSIPLTNGEDEMLEDEKISGQDKRLYEIIKIETDRMILETQRSMDYYRAQFHEGTINKIILMGGASLMPGFKEYFGSYFDAGVKVDDPFAEIDCDEGAFEDLQMMAPRFSTAVGLALRSTGE